ncbi:MAG: hypothetical protein M0Z94_03645 [Dehalococcoidales bacterium]|nr:hypothetical protein [Dehalococcoidales bacterium]
MRRYTREEATRETGARPEELSALEARGLLVPNRPRRFLGAFGGREEYYTEDQIGVLRWLLKVRRTLEASRK